MKISQLEFIGRKLRPIELALLAKYFLRLKRKPIQLADGRIYSIDPISDLGLILQKQGVYEPAMERTIAEILQEGDTFIDLGSNEGYFAIFASKRCGNRGRVFAIEPQQRLWEVITANCALNQAKNVQLLPFGMGATPQEMTLQLYPSTNSGASSFSPKFNFSISFAALRKKIYGTQTVKICQLDEWIDIFPPSVKLIKIDIEGFEFEALKGATQLLTQKAFQHILVEIHPAALQGMGQSEAQLDEFLANFGYTKKRLGNNLNLYFA